MKDIWSDRALELALSKKDYHLVAQHFTDTAAGNNAQRKYDDLVSKAKKRRRKLLTRIGIPFGILCLILLIGILCGNFLGTAAFVVRGLSILVGIAIIMSFVLWNADSDKGGDGDVGCFVIVFAIGCAVAIWFAGNAISDYNRRVQFKTELFANPTLNDCEKYMKDNPSDPDKDKILSLWFPLLLEECNIEVNTESKEDNAPDSLQRLYNTTKPLQKLKAFAETYSTTREGQIASERYKAICDSLYNSALSINTSRAWKQFKERVPESEHKDADERLEEINNFEWSTESRAWKTASRQGTLAGYERYLELYPSGAHANKANRKIVEINVRIAQANGTALPKMDQVGYGYGSTSRVSVTNSTSYTMTLRYYGGSERILTIPAHSTRSVSLANGDYSISASVSGPGVRNYYGSETLQGGSYAVEYYIVTTRY